MDFINCVNIPRSMLWIPANLSDPQLEWKVSGMKSKVDKDPKGNGRPTILILNKMLLDTSSKSRVLHSLAMHTVPKS